MGSMRIINIISLASDLDSFINEDIDIYSKHILQLSSECIPSKRLSVTPLGHNELRKVMEKRKKSI